MWLDIDTHLQTMPTWYNKCLSRTVHPGASAAEERNGLTWHEELMGAPLTLMLRLSLRAAIPGMVILPLLAGVGVGKRLNPFCLVTGIQM